MTIGIVGAGPVAQAMGYLLRKGGQPVVAISSRNSTHASDAARFIGGVRSVPVNDLPHLASHILIATSDIAIPLVATQLAELQWSGTVLHFSGGAGLPVLNPLRGNGSSGGVLHPLQTITSREQGLTALRGICFALAGDSEAVAFARELVATLEGRALDIAAERLSTYHAGAVMASNALTACLDAAVSLLGQAGVDRKTALEALEPLSRTALENAFRIGPEAALTGPVARGDIATIRAHLTNIGGQPSPATDLYKYIGTYLVDLARRRGGDPASLDTLAELFDGLMSTGSSDGQ